MVMISGMDNDHKKLKQVFINTGNGWKPLNFIEFNSKIEDENDKVMEIKTKNDYFDNKFYECYKDYGPFRKYQIYQLIGMQTQTKKEETSFQENEIFILKNVKTNEEFTFNNSLNIFDDYFNSLNKELYFKP